MTDTQKFISTLEMPEKVTLFKELYNELSGYGIEGDTELAHVNTFEASLLKSIGGSGTINEVTGLREYKGGGGSPPPPAPSTVTQTSEFPTELRPFIKDILGEAKGEFAREKEEGYIPFGGPQLAQFTPEQQQAFETGRQQFGAQGLAGTPLGQASTYYQPALAATALGTSEIGEGDIQRRMDPFLQNVVDVAKREARRDEDIAAQGRSAQAVGAGSFGGSRQAILEAEAERNLGQRLGDIQAAGLSQAFQNAQRAAEAQRSREMMGGRQFAGLGESAFTRARGDITGLAGIGEAQQGRTQQALDLARREFEEEKAFPSTALQRYSSLIRGCGLTPTQTVVSTPAPPIRPGLGQQIAGAAGTGIGLYGQFGGFGRRAGGLVGLMGGGTPMAPFRPPYELFPDHLNRQYNTGGMVGLNIGGQASGVAHPIPNQPVPSGGGKAGGKGLFNNLIMSMLQKHYNQGTLPGQGQPPELGQTREPFNVNLGRFANTGTQYHPGAATGGLLGLTVSKHQAGDQPDTGIVPLEQMWGHYFDPDKAEERSGQRQRFLKKLLPDESFAALLDRYSKLGTPKVHDPDAEYGLFKDSPEAKWVPPNYPTSDEIYQKMREERLEETSPDMTVDEYDAKTKAFRNAQAMRMFGADDVFPAEDALIDKAKKLQVLDPTLSSAVALELAGQQVIKSEPAVVSSEVSGDNVDINAALKGTPDPDPNASPSGLPDLPATAELSEATLAKQQAYLDALKGASGGYDQDKWGALTQLGLNLMSEQPRYEGESLLSIAGRAGKEPLATLQAAQKEQKAANLNYLKAELDVDVANEAFKTKADQARFTNILALKAANAQIRNADAAWLKARMGPKGVRSRKIGENDINMSKAFITNLVTPGAKSDKLLEKVTSLNPKITTAGHLEGYLNRMSNNNTVNQILAHEAESFKTNYFNESNQTKEPTKAELEKHMVGVLISIMEQNPEEHDGTYLSRLFDSW